AESSKSPPRRVRGDRRPSLRSKFQALLVRARAPLRTDGDRTLPAATSAGYRGAASKMLGRQDATATMGFPRVVHRGSDALPRRRCAFEGLTDRAHAWHAE